MACEIGEFACANLNIIQKAYEKGQVRKNHREWVLA